MSAERRAALAAAFDAAEKEAEGTEVELEEEEVAEEVDHDDAAGTDAEAEVAEEDSEEGTEEGEDSQRVEQEAASRQAPRQQGKPQKAVKATQQPSGQPATEVKAPVSWTPAEREFWAKMPPEAQKAVQRRELEVQQALNRSSDSRKFQDHFVKTVQPFAHLIRAQNSSPLQAVHNLMTTAAGLTTGTQPQKAAIIAEIIQNYGVDIQTLDDVLSKRPVRQATDPAPGALPQPIAEALRPIHQFMSQAEQARAQQIQQINQQAEQTVAQYAEKLEFFEDLRDEMADIMEIAAGRGRVMTMEQAHAMAVNLNPEIKKIIDQRKRAAQVNRDPNKIRRARKAGSSIVGAPNGAEGKGGKPTSRRAALMEAWDDLSS